MAERTSLVIVCLSADAPPGAGRAAQRALGLPVAEAGPELRWHRADLLCLQVAGGAGEEALAALRALPGVRRVIAPEGRLFEKDAAGRRPVRISAAGAPEVVVGGGLTVIGGPCAVETRDQIWAAAELVAEAGGRALRGGVFKPRTSPYAFGGLGERGLEHLARAGEAFGLPTVTEALEIANLDAVARHADVIQIGSRNMHNFPLLFDAGAHPSGRPILLKRGLAATLDELLQAAEYVLLGRVFAGHEAPGLILCERGIRTFARETRFTLDVAAIPILQQRSHLCVIADPSHAAGRRDLVPALARAAVAAGAAGLLVEVHPDPDRAWSDADQSLTPAGFRSMMRELAELAPAAP